MKIIIEHIIKFDNSGGWGDILVDIYKDQKIIQKQNQKIMADLQEIKTEFETLKTAIADERTQALAKLTELQTTIDNLQANLSGGGTVEERDALLADIKSQVAEVKGIIPDPVSEEPIEPGASL